MGVGAQDVRKMLAPSNLLKTEKSQECLKEVRNLCKSHLNAEEQCLVEEAMHDFEDAMVFTCIEKKPKEPTNFAMITEVHAQIAIDAIRDITGKVLTGKYEGWRVQPTASSAQSPGTTPGTQKLDNASFTFRCWSHPSITCTLLYPLYIYTAHYFKLITHAWGTCSFFGQGLPAIPSVAISKDQAIRFHCLHLGSGHGH